MTISIRRDRWGTPHIQADTEHTALFGQGYAQAEDRLPTILRSYRRAVGRMAEVFGPTWIEHDFKQQVFRHEAVARAGYEQLSAFYRHALERFIAGIKHYIHGHPQRVPTWALDIEPVHALALSRALKWDFILRQAGDVPGLDVTSGGASNMWAIKTDAGGLYFCSDPHLPWDEEWLLHECTLASPDFWTTGFQWPGLPYSQFGPRWAWTSGGPDVCDVYRLVLSDDGRRYRYDSEWRDIRFETFTIQVKTNDGLQALTRHQPYSHHGPVFGDLAIKPAYDDVLFDHIEPLAKLSKARTVEEVQAVLAERQFGPFNLLWVGSCSSDSTSPPPTASITDENTDNTQSARKDTTPPESSSQQGISPDTAPPPCLTLLANPQDTVLNANFACMNDESRVRLPHMETAWGSGRGVRPRPRISNPISLALIQESPARMSSPTEACLGEVGREQHHLYFQCTGRVPIRPSGYDWTQPVPGDTSATEWLGLHATADLPQIHNPPSGWILHTNNAPWCITPDSPLTEENYPAYMLYAEKPKFFDGNNARGRYLARKLAQGHTMSQGEALALAMDDRMDGAQPWLTSMFGAFAAQATAFGHLAEAIELLRNWNLRAQGAGMTLFWEWYLAMPEEDEFLALWNRILQGETLALDDQILILEALEDAVAALQGRWGTLQVAWEDVFKVQRDEHEWPLASGPGAFTLRVAEGVWEPDTAGIYRPNFGGACPLFVAHHLKHAMQVYSALPFGQSDTPYSPHFADQGQELFAHGKLKHISGRGDGPHHTLTLRGD